ncbi:DUF2917 domain-containing protein [Ramlibacter albus]|uniref:DUF2917 domain-containing protein n=1 Tax=Ramlibacter albus TaxID=2079448 RepID=A0A923S211_9BURK|nr:DUF2917 domain-containing protein [Ramlibacter albus]MBC5764870.1 DUF2917 domain-containing protein [Ramlibacter albus]
MTAQATTLHQSAAPALPGTWKLGAGRAITLQPLQDGILRVAHGTLWATFDGPHEGTPRAMGDHFVEVGDTVRIAAGERVVVEPWGRNHSAYFTWDPIVAPARLPRIRFADVMKPLADLRIAVALGVHAAASVVVVLVRAVVATVLPPQRAPMPRHLSAHCKA